MNSSRLAFAAAAISPPITRFGMRYLAPHLPPHWILSRLAVQYGLRIPVKSSLRNGMKVTSVLGDDVGETIRADACHEPVTCDAVLGQLKKDSVFYDVGAHIGQYSLLASPNCRRVHAFEAVPTTFEYLQRNVKQNALLNVTINNQAVSNRRGTVEIFEGSADNLGGSSLIAPQQTSGRTYKVPCISLDEYVQNNEEPDVIKMDVEGAEMMVLDGAAELLRQKRPVLAVEINAETLGRFGHTPEDLIGKLHALGYDLHSLEGAGYDNVLAIPRANS